jgi:hypothetical protein
LRYAPGVVVPKPKPLARTLAVAIACGAAIACSSSSSSPGAAPAPADVPPDPRCKTPGALPLSQGAAWFTDITADSGLADVQAIRVSSVDLDGDGLPDLVFHSGGTKRDTPAAPMKRVFMNRGGGHFEETTADSGLMDSRDGPGTGRMSHLSVFADVDGDGDLDLFDGTYADVNTDATSADADRSEIFLNDGKGHFKLAPRSAPSRLVLPTSGASFTDVNRDGYVDLFVGTWYDTDVGAGEYLYLGRGDGTFVDASTSSHVLRPLAADAQASMLAGTNRKPAYGVTACDLDDDGAPDLLVSAYGRSWNELWHNDGHGAFTEVGQGTAVAADDDVDYKPGNEFYHCWCAQNAGKCPAAESMPKIDCAPNSWSWTPGFDDQAARNGGNNFTTACADLDNDGDLDLIHADIKHWHIGDSSDASQIVRNDGNLKFTRLPPLAQPHTIPDWNEGNMDVAAFDVDGDGRKDVYLCSSDYPDTWGQLYHQREDGGFDNVTETAGVKHYHAHGFAAVDIDGDGDLDLVVTTSPARCGGDPKCGAKQTVKIYRNDVGQTRNFVQLRLHGTGSNTAAIGAKVTITSGGVKQVQEVSGGYGHFGLQHDTVLTFGLGPTCGVDAVEVRWPNADGTVQRFANVVPNHLVDLTEDDDKPRYVR